MHLFDYLNLLNPAITPKTSKVHLATIDDEGEDPLAVYLAGNFNAWQSWQTKKNFERPYVIALIRLSDSRWLFAGAYAPQGAPRKVASPEHYEYDLVEDPRCEELNGRLIIHHKRIIRQPYRNGESCALHLRVHELRASRLSIGPFPGFKAVLIPHAQLVTLIRENHESWHTALSSVAGVYLITDRRTGKLYVGSATGKGGIWERWSQYAAQGHGNNAELRKLLKDEGSSRVNDFHYAILEIADTHASKDDVRQREAHWKNVLMTRNHGLNAN